MEQADERDNMRLERTRNEKQYVALLCFALEQIRVLTRGSGSLKRRS